MSRFSRFPAHPALTCALWFCLSLQTACAPSAPLVVTIPPPTWRLWALPDPPQRMTVAQCEARLIEAEAALLQCDAAGRAVVEAWPR